MILASRGSICSQTGVRYFYDRYRVEESKQDIMVKVKGQINPNYSEKIGRDKFSIVDTDGFKREFNHELLCHYDMKSIINVVTWQFGPDDMYSGRGNEPFTIITLKIIGLKRTQVKESTLVASGNQFPLDGIHTDGFWYIRKEKKT